MDSFLNQPAGAILNALKDRQISAEELMRLTLEQIALANGRVNAIVTLRDAEACLADARAADAQSGTGGPLNGLPIAIKDLSHARGLANSMGSPVFADTVSKTDDLHVARLRAAGAIIIGKTNTPEFGLGSHTYNPVHGATGNAYAPTLSAGGSSGGAAVALACRMLALADGSDMMGSLRNPAGWNNVYGFRPSWGVVPPEPEDDVMLHRLSTAGPMARHPDDLVLMLDVMAGPVPQHPMGQVADLGAGRDIKDLRLGWLGDWDGGYPCAPGVVAQCEHALRHFTDLGATVEPVHPKESRASLWDSWITLRSLSVAGSLAPLYANPQTRDQLKPEAIWEVERGLALTAMQVHRASAQRMAWYREAARLFDSYDALILPTAQIWPFDLAEHWPKAINGHEMTTYHQWMEVVIPASLIGLPAVACPAGFGDLGLPMGIQVIGRYGGDRDILEIARHYHAATMYPEQHPPEYN